MKFNFETGRRRLASRIIRSLVVTLLAIVVTGHNEARAATFGVRPIADASLVEKTATRKTYRATRSTKRYVTGNPDVKDHGPKKSYAKKGSSKKRYAKGRSNKRRSAKNRSGKRGYVYSSNSAMKPYVVASTAGTGRPPLPIPRSVAAPEVKVAALGDLATDLAPKTESLTGGGVRWVASSSCLTASLRAKVYQVAANYGNVTVNSTCRSKRHNRNVGGARRSQHLTGNAVDFRVNGNWRAAAAFLRGHAGGYKHYGGGRFHIDAGPRRRW